MAPEMALNLVMKQFFQQVTQKAMSKRNPSCMCSSEKTDQAECPSGELVTLEAKSRPSPILLDLQTDLGLISFSEYSSVCSIWQLHHLGHKLIKQKQRIPMELSYYNIGTLRKKSRLNDAVINSYLYLIQEDINASQKPIRILDSWVSATILKFDKSKKSLTRTVSKLKLDGKQIVVIVLNNHNHWFFVQVANSRIYIYDSMRKTKKQYQQFYELNQLKHTLDWILTSDHTLQVIQNYPQQENKHDCGIMMLLGILDVVNGNFSWTFSQGKVVFWRARVASQLLKEKLMVPAKDEEQKVTNANYRSP